MRIVNQAEIVKSVRLRDAIDCMREAVIAQSRGECETPMPMHLELPSGDVHIKSSHRKGGRHFALKIAGTYAERPNGSIVLVSVQTGETVVFFDDGGYLTDLRTAAVSAMVTRELGRTDTTLGIVGTGVQARLQVQLHAEVLGDLAEVVLWGRDPARTAACAHDVSLAVPRVRVVIASSPAEVAARAKLLVTVTSSRSPLLHAGDLRRGTHISAVGADSVGKQELGADVLSAASLVLVDSLAQCRRLGELQHAFSEGAIEIGTFCAAPVGFDRAGITVADFTGLGAEDLFIAESCLRRS